MQHKSMFQDGPFVELLSPQGKTDLMLWRESLPGNVRKVFDPSAKTFVVLLSGSPSTAVRLTCPPEATDRLGLVQHYLLLQIQIPQAKDFSMEFAVLDESFARRRLQFSTFFREIQILPDVAKLPLAVLQRNTWCNLCIPLFDLVAAVWPGQTFRCLDGITICANCSLQKILTLRNLSFGNENKGEFDDLALPPSCRMRGAVKNTTQVLTMKLISSHVPNQKTRRFRLPTRETHLSRALYDAAKLRAEGIGLFQVVPIRRGKRLQVSSAPVEVRTLSRHYSPDTRKRRPASSDKYSGRRSSSLPRIEGVVSDVKTSCNVFQKLQPHKNVPASKPPVIPRQAWRGSSAFNRNRTGMILAMTAKNSDIRSRTFGGDNPPSGKPVHFDSNDLESSVDLVLSQRLEATLRGPDEEVVHYSDSENENDKQSKAETSASSKLGTEKFDMMSLFLNSSKTLDSSSDISKHRCLSLTPIGKLAAGGDEKLVLESMRSSLDMSWMQSAKEQEKVGKRRPSNESLGLKRHEYDDEDSDSEWDGTSYRHYEVKPGNPSSDMSLFTLEASASQSMLSSRLRATFHSDFELGNSKTKYNGKVEAGDGRCNSNNNNSGQPCDSGIEDAEGGSGCPVMDLMFDPELNCYYHPETKKYYQVASY